MNAATLQALCESEYGVAPTVAGAAEWAAARPQRLIKSPMEYVRACRRLARRNGLEIVADGRLIAAGYNHESPTQWVMGEGLDRFVAYWCRGTARPGIVGSEYNLSPEAVYAAYRQGLPAVVPRAGVFAGLDCRPCQQRRRQRLLRAARAARRTSISWRVNWFSTRALEALGRVSPELQRAALAGVEYAGRPIRVRDLNWAAATQVQADRSGRARLAWATGQRRAAMAESMELVDGQCEGPDRYSLALFLAPAFRVPVQIAVRLARGESPRQISGDTLTTAEAHAWLQDGGGEEPTTWLQRGLPAGTPPIRSMAVVRWLLAIQSRGRWSELERPRVAGGPGGERREYTYLEILDEIQDEDLARGSATSVRAAFESAALRSSAICVERMRDDHRVLAPLPRGWRLPRCARHLNTPARLAREGEELEHCVAGYAGAVHRRQSVILSLNVRGQRSTAELTADGRVLQHRGRRNSDPPEACERALQVIRRRISSHTLEFQQEGIRGRVQQFQDQDREPQGGDRAEAA